MLGLARHHEDMSTEPETPFSDSPLRGRLLVATPTIESGPFCRSVVFVLDHDGTGALGVIVNRPLDADVDEVLPEWGTVVAAPVCLFHGGPVQTDGALGLAVIGPEGSPEGSNDYVSVSAAGFRPMVDRVGLLDLDGPVPATGDFAGVRVFAGYAGWGPEQLEAEIEEGSWLVVDARAEDVMSAQPETLWHDVMRRQEGDLQFWSTLPADPTAN